MEEAGSATIFFSRLMKMGRVVAKINHADWANYIRQPFQRDDNVGEQALRQRFSAGERLNMASGGTLAHMNNGNRHFPTYQQMAESRYIPSWPSRA